MLIINELSFAYKDKSILKNISFQAAPGQITSIIGPNGVGKSTLLKCMARVIKPQSGRILLGDKNTLAMDIKTLSRCQAYVPQVTALTFPLTVEDFISLGRKPYVRWSLSEYDHKIINEAIAYLSLESFRQRLLSELSGGERQRVMLARALVQQPDILLLDEPTSSLDIKHQLEFMEILRQIARERQCTIIIVMHDLQLVARYSNQIILMHQGTIYKNGSPTAVMQTEHIEQVYGVSVKIVEDPFGIGLIPMHVIDEPAPYK